MAKNGHECLTFSRYAEVPSDNSAGERVIRPAVMICEYSYYNQSEQGALTQSVLMTVLRTIRVRGYQPPDGILDGLPIHAVTSDLANQPPANQAAE